MQYSGKIEPEKLCMKLSVYVCILSYYNRAPTLFISIPELMRKAENKNNILLVLILGSLAAVGPFSIDMYVPGFPVIAGDFHVDISIIGYSLTSYFLGISFGQLIYGPVTDRFGRKKPLIIGLNLYLIASVGCIFAPGVWSLIALRGMQALGGCVGMVASRAIVRDIFPPSKTAKMYATLVLILGVAPIVAPTLGGIVASTLGWRYIFVILTAIVLLILLAVVFFLGESKTPDPGISLRPGAILKQYYAVLSNREFLIYGLASGALSSGLFAYISGSAYVYMDMFHLSEQQYGWIYSLNAAGLIAGSQLNHLLLRRNSSESISVTFAGTQLLTGLSLIVATMMLPAGQTALFLLVIIYLMTHGILNPNTTALAINPFQKNAGSASSLIGFIQMTLGSIASALVSFFHNGTAYPMVIVMLCFSLLGAGLLFFGKLTAVNSDSRLRTGLLFARRGNTPNKL